MKLMKALHLRPPGPLLTPVRAQSIDWAEFTRDDSRISAGSAVGLGDVQEKDYATGDFDRDGWIDLVCVRKQPFTTTGRYRNVLFEPGRRPR